MACGCIVVGYHGIGGKDFMIGEGVEQNCILVENGNLPELGTTVEKLLTDWTAKPESFCSIIKNAISTGQQDQILTISTQRKYCMWQEVFGVFVPRIFCPRLIDYQL